MLRRSSTIKATKVYTSLIKEVPDSGYYLFNLADLYMAQGKLNEALATFEQAEKKFGPLDEVSFKKQQIYLKQNNLDKALQEGEALIKANPEEVATCWRRPRCMPPITACPMPFG